MMVPKLQLPYHYARCDTTPAGARGEGRGLDTTARSSEVYQQYHHVKVVAGQDEGLGQAARADTARPPPTQSTVRLSGAARSVAVNGLCVPRQDGAT